MKHEQLDPRFRDLVEVDGQIKVVGSGFSFTEGPIWHPLDHYLLFSDMPGDVRRRWDEQHGVREIMRPSNKSNGMTRDRDLNLVACEHVTSSVVRFGKDGAREVLASHFEGRELNSPNDIVIARDGAIYFTDPTYGRMPGFGVERQSELGFQGVYRIEPEGGRVQLLVPRDMFTQPNGLCFSPDESLLYVNDTVQANIRVFVVNAGQLTDMRVFASGIADPAMPGAPDGMKCDTHGNIWVTAPAGLWIYDPGGTLLGKIAVPEVVANLHWGGKDWRTLFITASTSLYALDVKVGPHVEAFMQSK